MASRGDSAGSLRPRARRSIAHVPRSKLTSGIDKENSTTDIGAILPLDGDAKPRGKDKKSRSKSLGPGGLDALQNSNGNRRKSSAGAIPLKSILKPTVPVSPVRNIPTFEETRRRTPARSAQQDGGNDEKADQGKEGMLIDFDTPGQPAASSTNNHATPFDSFNASSALRDGKAVEKEKKDRERKRILEQREARRKSMANRRVSFAPEATLHTWNVVEIPDDSTSSSTSNSTRRASSLANQQPAPEQIDPPSSPDAGEESDITFSPVKYQDLQQIRNQSASSDYDNVGGSQELSSSPFSGSSAGSDDIGFQGPPGDEDDGNSSGSDTNFDGESTAMSMDDMTVQSAATAQSDGSNSSTSSSARLNEALRQAAQEAGTKDNGYDETGEMSMEIADQEITGAFQPWIKKGQRQSFDWGDISASHDQENVNPSQPNYPSLEQADDDQDEDLSMDVTNAIGGILSKQTGRQSAVSRKSIGEETNYDDQTMEFTNAIGGIAQSTSPAKSIGADSNANEDEEMTMEFTSVVGGVLSKNSQSQVPNEEEDDDEDDQMESFTPISKDRNFSEWDNEEDVDGMDMEMTGAVGGILPPIEERTEPQDDDQTAGMDVTTAMGRILPSELEADDKDQAKKMMELESDSGQLGSSPFQEQARKSPAKSPTKSPARFPEKSPSKSPAPVHVAAVASESGSPSLASVRSRPGRQSLGPRKSTTPTPIPAEQESPAKKQSTPPKQMTPQAQRPTTPGKTPPSSNISFRGASPKKLFEPELKESASKYKSPGRKSLFGQDASTGQSTPLFVLRPHDRRRSSGLGIDKEGLGSPRVAEMLDKRRSIGENAPQFVPQEQPKQGGMRFEDPLKLQEEVDREREEEEYREDGHIPPPYPSERDATSNLKDMISSLTPKKNKFRGRKSLHVGAARGLLGKRPVELDQDDDEEEADNTPKRLKGREASPVKNIKLPAPPTVDETVRRSTRSPARGRFASSPLKASTTPTQEPRRSIMPSPMKDGSESLNLSAETEQAEEGENVETEDQGSKFPPIQLQEFLNMTNIHFMELTTTKRRHTIAPGSASKRAARLSEEIKPATFDDCVAAGFCTVPMLELYQHSCRELKSYISEGRQVIRSIETETYADNPPLFREYATAPPDIRLLMDNQFRNVKTHARLLSKATWYEWRMKLLEGLKEGLNRHVEEMKGDDDLLSKHEALLNSVVPAMVEKHSALGEQATTLQQLADEMENCDQDELRNARENLSSVEDEIALKKKQLQDMQNEIQEKSNIIEAGADLKADFTTQIQEAERIKEECRGWSAKEINELKDSVLKIERQTGWSIISAKPSSETSAGPLLTMSYRSQLQLMFHPGAFYLENSPMKPEAENTNMPIELRYGPHNGDKKPTISTPNLSPIASLVLKALQNHIATIKQSKTAPNQLLRFISEAWDLVLNLEEEARMLEFCGVTKLKFSEVDDKPLRARCTLLGTVSPASSRIPTVKGSKKVVNTGNKRIDVDFALKTCVVPRAGDDDAKEIGTMDFETEVIASKVYGFGNGNEAGISETEMQNILHNGLEGKKSAVQLGNGVWSKAVQMLTGAVF